MPTKGLLSLLAVIGLFAVIAIPGFAGAQTEDKALSAAELKTMVINLGYEAKDLNTEAGKEKIEFTITRDGFNVPIAVELSPSKRFIWLTAFLGDSTKMLDFSTRAAKLLAKNAEIQPSQFYTTTKGNLMIAIAVDNRNVTPAVLKWRIEKISGDVSTTSEVWKS